jgi:hypothetical protein
MRGRGDRNPKPGARTDAGWLYPSALFVVWSVSACASYKAIVPDAGATGGATGSGGSNSTGNGGSGIAGATGTGGGEGTRGIGGAGAGGTVAGTGGASTGIGGNGAGGSSDGGGDRTGTRALGESCAGDSDCASTHCTGSVCCDLACTGPCAQCSSTGHCQMPADDPACGTIPCPADTPCRDWATSITANRCKALGQCKAAGDCGYLNAPAKTYCALYQGMASYALVCDGAGNCGSPTVTCGADGECAVNPGVCCWTITSTSCVPRQEDCVAGINGFRSGCDESADCAPGFICCFYTGIGGAHMTCNPDCPATVDMGSQWQLCNPNKVGECKVGTCQATNTGHLPYFICM